MVIVIFLFSNSSRNALVYVCHGQVAVTILTTSPFYYRRLSHIYLRIIYGVPCPFSWSAARAVTSQGLPTTRCCCPLLATRLVMTIVTLSTPTWTLHHLLRLVILCNISCCLHHTVEFAMQFHKYTTLVVAVLQMLWFRLAFRFTVEPSSSNVKYEPTHWVFH